MLCLALCSETHLTTECINHIYDYMPNIMEFSGENLLVFVLQIFDTQYMYNFIHQNLKTIQELNDQNNNDGNDMGCEKRQCLVDL